MLEDKRKDDKQASKSMNKIMANTGKKIKMMWPDLSRLFTSVT